MTTPLAPLDHADPPAAYVLADARVPVAAAVLPHDFVNLGLHARQFLRREALAVGEVEPQAVLGVQRAALGDVVA